MRIQERICPQCGGPADGEGLCSSCRVSQTRWVTFDTRVTSTYCPSCNAQKTVSTWTDSERSREEIGPELVRTAVHLHPDVKFPKIDIIIRDRTENRSYADVDVSAVLYGMPVKDHAVIEIIWQREQCNRCNRISGSYYEGIVQVRAQGRKIFPGEVLAAREIACEIEDQMQAGGDRLSYISEMEDTREGLDITIGSQQIGLAISQALTQRLGGRYSTHPKLVGEKAGKKLFRVTYSVRLPRYIRGDILRIGKKYGQVIQVDGHSIKYGDLTNGSVRNVREDEVDEVIGNVKDATDALIAYVDGDIIGLVDPASGSSCECSRGPWRTRGPGDHIRVIKDRNTLIPVW
ncbi:MAG TPA: 60S ribosomal export protein NMD3 [Methanoregulaceae archaeon]|nr:60S ribosomal export protein NMD3 [Methanoregulaceae archaeon]